VTIIRRTATAALAIAVAAGLPCVSTAATPSARLNASTTVAAADIGLHRWGSSADWRSGRGDGLRIRSGRVRIAAPAERRTYRGKRYDVSTWTSPRVRNGFRASELIPSWNASAPAGTWLEVAVRARRGDRAGSWDVVARWADADRGFRRVSLGEQGDDLTRLNVDTIVANAARGLSSWQLRISLLRRAGSDRSPVLHSASIMTSRVPDRNSAGTSRTGMRRRVDLRVPAYSQMVHKGTYPQWDNGGEAWCSPTSTTMLLGYWDVLPSARSLRWIPDDAPQKPVIHAARHVYDYRYDGAGNWPFNTAYAGTRRLDAYVTRLRSLRSAERYIKAGIPLVASIAFAPGALDGAPINSSSGHLLVIRGFTAAGDVIVNDPAAARRRGVRRVYDRTSSRTPGSAPPAASST
jgi:hypothetical protein